MSILEASDLQSVRRAIDVTLDDGVLLDEDRILPDSVILDPIYSGPVEAEIGEWLPQSYPFPGSLSLPEQAIVRQSAIFLTAARVYPAIPVITQEQMGEHRYRREYETVADVVARLRGAALDVLNPLLDLYVENPVKINVARFRRASATRGR